VVRDGTIVWSGMAGLADVESEREPTLHTQYRIGSITKSFTAVLLLQLRDAGRLDLDDRLDQHLPGISHGDATLRRMLAHLSGLQREAVGGPGGEVWETLEDPEREALLAGFEQAGKVLPPGRRWHYSNLAYSLLGEVVARRAGTDRTAAGELVDELGERVGSAAALRALLAGAGLHPEVSEVAIELPWPGPAAFVDYRLATVGVAGLVDDPAAVRREAIAAVAALPPETLPWRPRLVLGLGRHG